MEVEEAVTLASTKKDVKLIPIKVTFEEVHFNLH